MKILLCTRFVNQYIIVNRLGNIGLKVGRETYKKIEMLHNDGSNIPEWLTRIIIRIYPEIKENAPIRSMLIFRKEQNFNYGRASYEISEACNFKCVHCYLGKKEKNSLSLNNKIKVIDSIYKSGSVWLQITGGEPLLDSDFIKVYTYAHSLGFLITISTNGYFLSSRKIINLFKKLPPYRLTVSMYGATRKTYEEFTMTPGSFKKFEACLSVLKSLTTKSRINIILSKINANEKESMIRIAKPNSDEYFVFNNMIPTINGDDSPLNYLLSSPPNCLDSNEITSGRMPCEAGLSSFHVNSMGKASICKISREPTISLTEKSCSFEKLKEINKTMIVDLCGSCDRKTICKTCPPVSRLYKQSIPDHVCRKIQ